MKGSPALKYFQLDGATTYVHEQIYSTCPNLRYFKSPLPLILSSFSIRNAYNKRIAKDITTLKQWQSKKRFILDYCSMFHDGEPPSLIPLFDNTDSFVILGRILQNNNPYNFGSFLIKTTILTQYPILPPMVRISDPIYHPNVQSNEHIHRKQDRKFSAETSLALTLCPTATWQRSATTVVGLKTGISGFDSSSLNGPFDIYIDKNTSIYVLDSGNYRVQYLLSNSTIVTTVINGSYGTALNQFVSMRAINIDGNGSIYILDGSSNGRVTKWSPESSSGAVVAGGNGIGNNTNQLNASAGMFIDWSTRIIWIADKNNHRIVKWSSPMTSMVVCGSYGSNDDQFQYPSGVFVDTSDSNTLYVADTYNHRIQMWQTEATHGTTVAGITSYYGNGLNQLWYPTAVMVDNNQNMHIVDRNNHRIVRWRIGASAGVIVAGDTVSGVQSNQLYYPMSLNFDSSGSLYVVDTYNNRIQKFLMSCAATSNTSTTTPLPDTTTTHSSNGSCSMTRWSSNASTIAGSPIGLSGYTSTTLNYPQDVFLDQNNALYVLDSSNYRVLLFLPNSTIGITVVNGSYGSMLNQFGDMQAIRVDASGNIYIVDCDNHRVVKYAPGDVSGTVVAGGNGTGADANHLRYPYDIFIGSNTSVIWIADTVNHRIVRWDSPTKGAVVCGSFGSLSYQFYYPCGLYVDTSASNTLYVADTYNHRIQMWLPAAMNGTTVAGQTRVYGNGLNQLDTPTAVIMDQNGYLYITDSNNNRVLRWIIGAISGMIVGGGSSYGTLPSQLNYPYRNKFDSNGALVIVDYRNNRIQRFDVSCLAPIVNTTTTTVPTTILLSTTARTSHSSK
ncbi:hypothetical protein I4U23_016730 [Adineta vaga]|nr:hypothetical protein I4U23_016730 [Adineta vaga]